MRNSLNLNSAPSLKGSAGGKFSLRPAFQLSPFSVTSRNTGAGFNRGGGIVSGNESRDLCTFLLEGPSIQQQRFMLICSRNKSLLMRVGADADIIVCARWREGGRRTLLHYGICYHFSTWQHIKKHKISNNSLKSKELKQKQHSTTNALL